MRSVEDVLLLIESLCDACCLVRYLLTCALQIFTDSPELSPLSPTGPVLSAPTRQSKKVSRQNRPLAVYNPQVLDIQNGKRFLRFCLYLSHFLVCWRGHEGSLQTSHHIYPIAHSKINSKHKDVCLWNTPRICNIMTAYIGSGCSINWLINCFWFLKI